ncbi:MAG: response regulator, partial [Hyphomicrobiales bacterium]|nr:response regulator [Hyphomicrobiales bacterium]
TAATAMREQGMQLPIMALTANAMKGFEKDCLDAGYSDYFTKPIDIDSFVARLARILDAKPDNGEQKKAVAAESVTGKPATGESATVKPATGTEPIKPSVTAAPLESTLKDKDSHFAALAERFAARLGGQLEKMAEAWRTQDYSTLAALAHWLKGAGGTVGFDLFTAPARSLESAAKAAEDNAIGPAMQTIWDLAARIPGVDLPGPLPEPSANPAAAPISPADATANDEPIVSRLAGNPRMQRHIDRFLARLSDEDRAMQAAWL